MGKRADLILLEADPLQDVRNAARRAGAMVQDRWFTEKELRECWTSRPGRSLSFRAEVSHPELLKLEIHLSQARAIQLPDVGVVVELAQVGGLHHRYERKGCLRSVLPPGHWLS